MFLGALAALSTGAYLYKSSKENDTSFNGVEGLNIHLNPEKLVESAIMKMRTDPQLQDRLVNAAKQLIRKKQLHDISKKKYRR